MTYSRDRYTLTYPLQGMYVYIRCADFVKQPPHRVWQNSQARAGKIISQPRTKLIFRPCTYVVNPSLQTISSTRFNPTNGKPLTFCSDILRPDGVAVRAAARLLRRPQEHRPPPHPDDGNHRVREGGPGKDVEYTAEVMLAIPRRDRRNADDKQEQEDNERSSVAGKMQPTSHCSACFASSFLEMATLATSTHYKTTDLC